MSLIYKNVSEEPMEDKLLRLEEPHIKTVDCKTLREMFADKYGITDIDHYYRACLVPDADYLDITGERRWQEDGDSGLPSGGLHFMTRSGSIGVIPYSADIDRSIEHEGIHAYFYNRQQAYKGFNVLDAGWIEAIPKVTVDMDYNDEDWAQFYSERTNKDLELNIGPTRLPFKLPEWLAVRCGQAIFTPKRLCSYNLRSLDLAQRIRDEEGVHGFLDRVVTYSEKELRETYG